MRVDIVNELRSKSSFVAQVFEDRRNGIDKLLFIECRALVAALGAIALTGRCKSTPTVPAKLDPPVGKSVGERLLQGVETLLLGLASLMVIHGNTVPPLPAEHFVDGHAGPFALDVPQRH